MKRELKPGDFPRQPYPPLDCRAYPDEKGIETYLFGQGVSKLSVALQSLSR